MVKTSYDGGDRISSVYIQGGTTYASALSYAPPEAVASMTLGNGLVETTAYNDRLQPTSIAAGMLATFTYNYSAGSNNGNVMSQTISDPGLSLTQTYGYDGVNRLTSGSETNSWTETYGYDQYGNRTSVAASQYLPTYTPTNGTIGIDANTNRITDTGFSYDAAGNLTQAPVVYGGAEQTYAYDAENKLVNFNSGVAVYAYDGDGHRVEKTMGSATTIFVYDVMGKLIAEYSNTMATGSGTKYITADNLGSTRLVTDANRNVLARRDYLPFGEEIPSSFGTRSSVTGYGATEDTRQKFTGKERDAESGLDNFIARYDSSGLARFMSVDPENDSGFENQDDPQSWNAYAYVRNNPLLYTDPDGRDFHVCIDNGKGGQNCFDVSNEEELNKLVKGSGATAENGKISVNINGQNVVTGTYRFFVGPGIEAGGLQSSPLGDTLVGGFVAGFANLTRGFFEGLIGGGVPETATVGATSGGTAEVTSIIQRAAGVAGNQSIVVSSREVAEQAAEDWVGAGARDLVDRQTGQWAGKISADGTKIARFTSANKPQPYINLINKMTGGNLHVRF